MRWTVLVLLFFGMFINFADKSITGLAAVPIMKEFNLSYADWGLVGSSYYWLYPVTGIFGAAWADRIGAKKVLGFLMLTWAVLQIGVLAIAGLPLLLLYRFLLGAFEGPFSPIAYNHANTWFPPKLRGLANSVVVSGATLGAMVAAPILVALIHIFGWRVAFAFLGAASIVWFVAFQFTRGVPRAEELEEDEKPKKKQLEKLDIKAFLILLSRPSALFTTLAYFSTYLLVVWFAVWLPVYLVKIVNMSNIEMGYAVSGIGVVSVGVYIGVSVLSDRMFKRNKDWRISRVYVVGLAMIMGALLLASTAFITNAVWVIIAMCFAKGLTYGILTIGPTIIIHLLPERGGLMTSILTSSGNLAGIVGPLITGYIVGSSGDNSAAGFDLSIIFMAGLITLFGILFTVFVRPNSKVDLAADNHAAIGK
ncbi:MFS transporter [Bacillus sp. V2I10]|uniref:MFS transporter n=1 Tax=Bacillus sp. V2I10 TaxID=3042276 RepID=UPI002787DD75|nr:MFS transporter [Bacillus sp. V2I10]MDQ0860727.1 ACS family hexuronate transporter-like MFS transporter [Bacillus sp. V2I10]